MRPRSNLLFWNIVESIANGIIEQLIVNSGLTYRGVYAIGTFIKWMAKIQWIPEEIVSKNLVKAET